MVTAAFNKSSPAGKEQGRLMAIDLGARRVGLAVSDELRVSIRPVAVIERRSWKDLLQRIKEQIEAFDARGVVVGLPLNMDGSEGAPAAEAREVARKLGLSLNVPVYLQDERLSSEEAKSRLRGIQNREPAGEIDSASAAIILEDFIEQEQSRPSRS